MAGVFGFRFLSACVAVVATLQACARPHAKVERYNGEPAVMVDGVPQPPMSMLVVDEWHPKSDAEQKAYWRRLADAGARVFYVTCTTAWHQPANKEKGWPDGTDGAIAKVRRLLDAVPEAWIMLRLNVSPSAEWVEAHPEEMVTYDDGSHRRTVCTSISGKPISGMLSLCSGKWREEGACAIEEFFRRVDASDVSGRVIGTFLCAGGGTVISPSRSVASTGVSCARSTARSRICARRGGVPTRHSKSL